MGIDRADAAAGSLLGAALADAAQPGQRGRFGLATQELLSTAGGLLHASMQLEATGTCHPAEQVRRSLERWLLAQRGAAKSEVGWLSDHQFMRKLLVEPAGAEQPFGLVQAIVAGLLVPAAAPPDQPGEAEVLGRELAEAFGEAARSQSAGAIASLVHRAAGGQPLVGSERSKGTSALPPPVATLVDGALHGAAVGAKALVEQLPGAVPDDERALAVEVATDCATWLFDRPRADQPDDRFARLFERYVS